MFTNSILEPSFQELDDALDDFRDANYLAAHAVLPQFVEVFDSEPLAGFIRTALPKIPTSEENIEWIRTIEGSGQLLWSSIDKAGRVAQQIGLIRRIAADNHHDSLLGFAMSFTRATYSDDIPSCVSEFANVVLGKMIRDLKRLAESRVLPVINSKFDALPSSGDSTVDGLLATAIERLRDPAPKASSDAVEKLWDAWERLKSLDDSDKKTSAKILLDGAASDGPFRTMLEDEAKKLTEIGNSFHIRHFETSRVEIEDASHFDYLFHRLFALIYLLVTARAGQNN
jgi:hypothetical protein